MFNRTYQIRANRQARGEAREVRQAGGGHELAAEAAFCLPWAGLFRPKPPWRSLVILAALGERLASENPFYRPKQAIRARIAANRCKKRSRKLQGMQLELFPAPGRVPDIDARNFAPASNFYRPVKLYTPDPERPLADVFPEAYENQPLARSSKLVARSQAS